MIQFIFTNFILQHKWKSNIQNRKALANGMLILDKESRNACIEFLTSWICDIKHFVCITSKGCQEHSISLYLTKTASSYEWIQAFYWNPSKSACSLLISLVGHYPICRASINRNMAAVFCVLGKFSSSHYVVGKLAMNILPNIVQNCLSLAKAISN